MTLFDKIVAVAVFLLALGAWASLAITGSDPITAGVGVSYFTMGEMLVLSPWILARARG